VFQAEVLQRLRSPIERTLSFKDEKEFAAALEGLNPNLSIDKTALRMYYAARVFHHLRSDLVGSESLVETEIVPDYREFRRQLAAERIGFWGKVLEKTNKVFQINAPIASPRFWADAIAAIGPPLALSTERRLETLTNKHLAFQFLRILETEIRDNN
jgi:hypothetical protein